MHYKKAIKTYGLSLFIQSVTVLVVSSVKSEINVRIVYYFEPTTTGHIFYKKHTKGKLCTKLYATRKVFKIMTTTVECPWNSEFFLKLVMDTNIVQRF